MTHPWRFELINFLGDTTAKKAACPFCKHAPFDSIVSKALRSTARSVLKSELNKVEKIGENTSPSVPAEPREKQTSPQQIVTSNGAELKTEVVATPVEEAKPVQNGHEQLDQSDEVVQSIEVGQLAVQEMHAIANMYQEPSQMSRRPTLESGSGNEHDDEDIEINVGPDYDLSELPERSKRTPPDDGEQWFGDQQHFEKPIRRNSNMPQTQQQTQNNTNQSFLSNDSFDNNFDMSNPNFQTMPSEAISQFQNMMGNGMNPNMQPMGMSEFSQALAFLHWTLSNGPQVNNTQQMAQMQMTYASMMQRMQQGQPPSYAAMQSMMPLMAQMGLGGQNWNNMGNFMNPQFFNSMMNNGASFNNSQQYQQNYQNGDPRFNRHGSFDRGRGRGRKNRGRGGFYQNQYQDQYGGFNQNTSFQNQYIPGYMQNQPHQYDNSSQQGGYQANNDKENEQHANDDEFAPGGQDEVQEALGDSYNKKTEEPKGEEVKFEETAAEDVKQEEEYQQAPSPATDEPQAVVESPRPEPKQEYIPEAYREDLDFGNAVPPSAPSGPSAKDVPYRARGHGRYPSAARGRGSFQGATGFPPRSPARPVSQHQNQSPPHSNQVPGVVGAPTGPRAMREKDVPPPTKILSRQESDVGFKIRGTASRATVREEPPPRSATPKSTYEDHDDRDRDSRRYSKHDRKHESSRHHVEDDYDDRSDRKRRKSRREEDYDMDEADQDHSRSDSQDRSHRSGRRDKDRSTRDKYSSSTSKHKSSRKQEYEENDYGDDPTEDSTMRSKPSKKSSSRYDDRDERRDRDYERAEKDKHRKRSRHDRDREDNYEDVDEEESRRRSRKHKKEHKSEKPRDETELGMRITGRSARQSENNTPTGPASAPQPDKDPHTLEREKRNKERMLKEQQRREQAAKAGGGLSGGRQRLYKYEDDLEAKSKSRTRR